MTEHTIKIDKDKCIGCGLCLKDCPAKNIEFSNKKAGVKSQECIKCGHCGAICPKAAVTISGYEEPPQEIGEQTRVNPQELLNALKSRRSIRQFQSKPVSPESVKLIIEAGRLTPTAKNAQDISYIVLRNKKDRAESLAVRFFRKIQPLAGFAYPAAKGMSIDKDFFFKGAPMAIVIVSDDKVSASLAASNMALMAEACGLGVLYSGFFTIAANMSGKLKKELSLEGKAVTTLVIGYSDVKYQRTAQKESARVTML